MTNPASVAQVKARSGDMCERCSSPRNLSTHHRKLRKHGGTDDVWNLVRLCDVGGCHDKQVHQQPARAREEGWLVSAYADPATVPVLMGGDFYLLTSSGGYERVGDAA